MAEQDSKTTFKQRVHHLADKLDVEVTGLAIRPMKRKWASCSAKGHLNFNDQLLPMDQDIWDYVIVHELLHVSVPNHGKLWKSLMRAHLGDWERVARKLRSSEGR